MRASWSCATTSVYPRVCGGTNCAPGATFPKCGLSPRVRGNPPVPGI